MAKTARAAPKMDQDIVLEAIEAGALDTVQEHTRTMLKSALPHAVSSIGVKRHAYQAQLLDHVAKHLKVLTESSRGNVEAESAKASEMQQKVNEMEAAAEKAAAALEEANKEAELKATEASERKAKAAEEVVLHKQAMDESAGVLAERDALEVRRTEVAELGSQINVDTAVSTDVAENVCTFLKGEGVEKGLVVAVPAAMGRAAEERTEFDKLVVDTVKSTQSKVIQDLDKNATDGAKAVAQAKAEVLGAWAIMRVAKEEADKAKVDSQDAHERMELRKEEHKTALDQAADQKAELSACLVSQTLAETRQSEFADAEAALHRLVFEAPAVAEAEPAAEAAEAAEPAAAEA